MSEQPRTASSNRVAHTPGPWVTAGIQNPTRNPRMSVWGPTAPGAQSGEWIAKDVTPANAEFIVRACNSHDDLLAALKLYVDHFGDPLKVARAAIARAEGSQS